MEVHIKDIDNDLYITFNSAMNILDEIQRLRKVNYKLDKELTLKEQQYEYLRHNEDKEIKRLRKNLDFMIDKNNEKQDRIDKALEYINNSLLYGIMGSGKTFYSTIIKEVRIILTGGK